MHFIIKYIKYLLNLSPAQFFRQFAYIHKTNQKKISDFANQFMKKNHL